MPLLLDEGARTQRGPPPYGVLIAATAGAILALAREPNARHGAQGVLACPSDGLSRGLACVSSLLFLANCLSPQLGLRHEYSFAMFSNLRADEHRWNSLVFPQRMSLFGHEYVSVDRSVLHFARPIELPLDRLLDAYGEEPDAPIEFI